MTGTISSQDFRNAYEKLYNDIRRYLWPIAVLEVLADIEVNIYSAFIDIDKLRADFAKLRKSINDVLKDDKLLSQDVRAIEDLLKDKEVTTYLRLPKVNESNPENMKQLKTISDDEEESL